MLLTITYEGKRTQDLGYLLFKNPYRPQTFELSHGKAHVFYPEVSDVRTTAALLLSINPIDLARGKVGTTGGGLFDYVNDRPYVSSSFMSTAISRVFGTAMTGRADEHQALADTALPLTARVTMLPCRGEREMLPRVFEPLGYTIESEGFLLDERFPGWGESDYVNLTIKATVRLSTLLEHLYVLIPVFDRNKHYWVGEAEVEKLLRHSEDWLPSHPEKKFITARYLSRHKPLISVALSRLAEAEGEPTTPEDASPPPKKPNLNDERLAAVVSALKKSGAASVLDLGCGIGNLLRLLLKDGQFTRIAGADVSIDALTTAKEKLFLKTASEGVSERIQLFQASLTYQDARFLGYDAVCVVEVIEHLDPARLVALERVLFAFTRPKMIVLTTPNREYNAMYPDLINEGLRHIDHRFEWTRAEFRAFAEAAAARNGYRITYVDIGQVDEALGSPTQMGVFSLEQ